MNLNHDPTVDQLRALLRQTDDSASHHILWVKKSGEVVLSRMSKEEGPNGFEGSHPEMKARYEAFLAGNEYVGPEAAEDDDWVNELFHSLTMEWPKVRDVAGVTYIDRF